MKKILLVEDYDLIRKLYKEKLNRSGYQVDVAGTVSQAFTQLLREDYGLVLLDIMLPGGENGFDLLEKMKQNSRFKEIPVIVLTNLEGQEKTARDIGANDCLIKSNITFDLLLKKINDLIK